MIERVGRDKFHNSRDASYCGETEHILPDMQTEFRPYCECLLDFESAPIEKYLREHGIQRAFQSSGSVYWHQIGTHPLSAYLDADVPVLDETKGLNILDGLTRKTSGNCQYSGLHDVRHHPAKHIHFACDDPQEGLLDKVADTVSEMFVV
jgi:hypothetical protein